MELKNLKSIFNEQFFRIPDYQRGYSWGEKQFNDIWRDLEMLENDKIHYTGLLSVTPHETEENTVQVVDGQQRLTTAIILIHVICESEQLKDVGWICDHEKEHYIKKYLWRKAGEQGTIKKMIFGYEKDNPSHNHFKVNILKLESTETSERSLYTNQLDKAKEFFVGKIKSLKKSEVETLLMKVTTKLNFLYYILDEKINPFVTFETLNYRGKPLTTLELLKNRLLYLSTELSGPGKNDKKQLRDDINNAWKTIYEYLGKKEASKLADDDFLMDHWIMYFGNYDRSASKVFARFLLDEHFTLEKIRDKTIQYDDIKKYAYDIQKVVAAWYYTHHPDTSPYLDEIKEWLFNLGRIEFRSFRPIISSVLANEVDDSKVVKLLKHAEMFNFVVLGIGMSGRQSNYKAVPIYNITHEAHMDPSRFNPEKLNLTTLGVPFNDFAFTKEFFLKAMREHDDAFDDWQARKYFLYEYEKHLHSIASSNTLKLSWKDIETIEHIYPKQPNRGEWSAFNNKKAKKCLNELGNFLLISRSANSKLSNKPFKEKKLIYKTDSYSAIEVGQYNNWTPKEIKARQEKMLDFLWQRWKIKNPIEVKIDL